MISNLDFVRDWDLNVFMRAGKGARRLKAPRNGNKKGLITIYANVIKSARK